MINTRSLPPPRLPAFWLSPLLGTAAGLGAVALMLVQTPLYAALYLVGLTAAGFVLVAPHAGMYLLAGAMIGQWPGQAIKLLGAMVGLSALLWALAFRRRLVPRDPLLLALLLFTGVVWTSALTLPAEVRADPADEAIQIALGYSSSVVLYWTISTLMNSRTVIRKLVAVMLWSGIVVALIGFAQFRLHFFWIQTATPRDGEGDFTPAMTGGAAESQLWDGAFRVESITGTPDLMAMVMQILIPFAFFWTIQQTTTQRRAVGVIAVGMLAAGMVLSLTRGVLVSTALITIPLIASKMGWRRSLPYLAIGSVLVIAMLAVFDPVRSRTLSIITEWFDPNPSTSGGWRNQVYPVALTMILDNFWTGVGLGQHRLQWHHYAPFELTTAILPEQQEYIHSAYLAIGMELGVIGLALLVLLIVVAWLRLRGLQAYFRSTRQLRTLRIVQAAEVAWVPFAFNIALYPQVDKLRYYWLLLALIGALSRLRSDQEQGVAPSPVETQSG